VKLKGYKIFTIGKEGVFNARSFILEKGGRRYEIRRYGFFKKRFEFHRKGKIKMQLEVNKYLFKKEVIISQFGLVKANFSPKIFGNNFSIETHYGMYHVVKDGLLSASYTISNSTTEVVKISSTGLLKKNVGIAIHKNEHIEFLLCLCFYIIYRSKKKNTT